ncbi:MAG: bifunctional methylenetetrahydrofolate dehydrogenase/methenyltetrahydrofolate cyclohydrolase FolD [Alphaproteobacteria bacterium]|nr:bifunctional methylenetetrahydrofolate dehydrogenase/methenyltetrahydrofolate cyclohydrolase FolD [Alphaproteobacteria bacterium]
MKNIEASLDDKIIDGKAFAESFRKRIANAVGNIKSEKGLKPSLAVILVGNDPASHIYVRNKGLAAKEAGITAVDHRLDVDTSQEGLLKLIAELNDDPLVHGILVQLPLPNQINPAVVIDSIDPAKDVDGFHVVNTGRLATGKISDSNAALIPCTPLGCIMLLEDRLGDLSGLEAVVLGRSNIVGKPMLQLLTKANCTVTIAHSRTKSLKEICRRADIVVSAIGQPRLVKVDWIKPGATVIDVGINRIPMPTQDNPEKMGLVGDVDFNNVIDVVSAITPVPGGVGPMTIACLLANTVTAACRQSKIEPPKWSTI